MRDIPETTSTRLLSLLAPAVLTASIAAQSGYRLTFADEFSGTSLDTNKWAVVDNSVRKASNVSVGGGTLRLKTVYDASSKRWTSGFVYTKAFRQRFGRFVARMKIADDRGLNNAFWLNTPHELYGNTVDRMEIDIIEAHYPTELRMTVHDWAPAHWARGTVRQAATSLSRLWHEYALEWRPDGSATWYFDGKPTFSRTAAEMHALASTIPLEVLFSTLVNRTPGNNLNGQSMEVDWVRVYQKDGWTGASSASWSDAGSWGPWGVPGAGDMAVFNRPASRSTISLPGDTSVLALVFDGPQVPRITVARGNRLRLGHAGAGGITVDNDIRLAPRIECDLVAEGPLVFQNFCAIAGEKLLVSGSISGSASGRTLTFSGPGTTELAGRLGSQLGGIRKIGRGTAVLSAFSGHGGTTIVQDGVLVAAAPWALGATSAATTVATTGTLAFRAGVTYAQAEPVEINGFGFKPLMGAVDVDGEGTATFLGTVRVRGTSAIAASSSRAALVLQDVVNPAGTKLILRGSGTVTVSGGVTGGGQLFKRGSGTARLTGTTSDQVHTAVDAGTLLVTGALRGTSVDVKSRATLGGGGNVAAQVRVRAGGTLAPGALGYAKLRANQLRLEGELHVRLGPGTADALQVAADLDLGSTTDVLRVTGPADEATDYVIARYAGRLLGRFDQVRGLPTGYRLVYGTGTNDAITLVRSGHRANCWVTVDPLPRGRTAFARAACRADATFVMLLALRGAAVAIPLPRPLYGSLRIDPLTMLLYGIAPTSGGKAAFPVVVPNDPRLVGLELWFQGLDSKSLHATWADRAAIR